MFESGKALKNASWSVCSLEGSVVAEEMNNYHGGLASMGAVRLVTDAPPVQKELRLGKDMQLSPSLLSWG